MPDVIFSVGSMLNDAVFGKCQAPVRTLIEQRAAAWEQLSVISKIFNVGTSRHFGESIASMTGMEGFQPVGEGGGYPTDGMQQGHTKVITHMTWKNSFAVTQEAVEDAVVMDLKRKPTAFVKGYYSTRERFAAAMIAGGLGESINFRGVKFDTTGADKKPLFAKDHPSALEGKGAAKPQSNLFAGAFSNKVLGQVATRMQNFVDDRGEPLDIRPNTIIIPNDEGLKYDVFEAIGADKDPETSNNGFNYHYGMWDVIVWPYLNGLIDTGTATDKPFILLDRQYNETYEGADWLERVKLTVESYRDPGNDNNIWKGRARFGVGFNDFRAFAMGGVTGGTAL